MNQSFPADEAALRIISAAIYEVTGDVHAARLEVAATIITALAHAGLVITTPDRVRKTPRRTPADSN